MTTYTEEHAEFRLSREVLDDHLDRLYETDGMGYYVHVDGERYGRIFITKTTARDCVFVADDLAVKELLSDLDYQYEIREEHADNRAFANKCGNAHRSLAKQIAKVVK